MSEGIGGFVVGRSAIAGPNLLSAQQLVALACQTARCPGYTAQVGQLLNSILSELCMDFDLELTKGTYYFNFQPGLVAAVGPSIYGGGPYPLPADYLRAAGDRPLTYWINGVPYMPIRIDLDEMDMQVQQAGQQNYPSRFTTDLSLADEAAGGQSMPGLYVFQPPSGAFQAQIRYYRQMPDILAPESSATVPWFPNQRYLRKKLTADAMDLTGDDRKGDIAAEADDILTRYLKMKDDPEGRTKRVKFDRRQFGSGSFNGLKNTKTLGW